MLSRIAGPRVLAVNREDLLTLLRQLDADDDHFDGRISDQEFLRRAASTRGSLTRSAAHDPGLAAAVHALDALLGAAQEGQPPLRLQGELRSALADLEQFR
jgi:hypothetical protein